MVTGSCGREKEEAKPQVQTPVQYTLTYIAGEHGIIEGASPQTVRQGNDGSRVSAVPAEHYHFTGWSDGLKSADRIDTNVMADLTVSAEFAIDQYSLKYTTEKNGTIEGAAAEQTVGYGGNGSEVKAVPGEGYHFSGWSDGESEETRIDSNVTADLTVSASFALNEYKLTYIAGKHGTIQGASSQTVVHGNNSSRVTALPAEHYHFIGWSDGMSSSDRTDKNVTGDLSVTADFSIDQYTLTYTSDENGSIKGDTRQTVDHGGTGSEVTAVPGEGYHFINWSDGVYSKPNISASIIYHYYFTSSTISTPSQIYPSFSLRIFLEISSVGLLYTHVFEVDASIPNN